MVSDREKKVDQLKMDYQATFESEHGIRVLADIRKGTTMDRTSIKASEPIDKDRLIFHEAQRTVFLHILKKLSRKVAK